ncbi:MAG: hypothetical protein HXK45_04285 [Atopobium sp.]|nr:hypothetical protein [Atopobium sp.]
MWLEFFQSVVVIIALLYVPGVILLHASGMPKPWALVSAPLVSCALFFIEGEIFSALNIPIPLAVMVLVPLLIAVLVNVYVFYVAPKHKEGLNDKKPVKSKAIRAGKRSTNPVPAFICEELPFWIPLLYVAIGLLTVGLLFLPTLPSTSSFVQGWDIVHHLDVTQAMIESQKYSSIHYDFYSTVEASITPWEPGTSGFYPSGWNIIVALTTQLVSTTVPIAGNALNFVSAAIIFPLSICSLIAKVLPKHRIALISGAFVCLAFFVFPWSLLIYGPIFPNTVAFCVMPSIWWIFMQMTRSKTPKHDLIWLIVIFVLGLITLFILHPSTIFSSIVVLLPWSFARIGESKRRVILFGKQIKPVTLAYAFFIFALVIWSVFYYVLIVRGVALNFWWSAYSSLQDAILHALGMDFIGQSYAGGELVSPQPILSICVLVGAVWTFKHKQARWMVSAFMYLSILCIFIITFDVPLKGYLSGFWYTDPFRIAASCVIMAIPLAALGLATLAEAALETFASWREKASQTQTKAQTCVFCNVWAKPLIAGAVIACVVVLNYVVPMPNLKSEKPIPAATAFKQASEKAYGDHYILTSEELEFLRRVELTVPAGAVIANLPQDGSLWAYGTNDLHVLWRFPNGYDASERPASAILRKRLNRIASDPEVLQTARDLNVQYVLILNNVVDYSNAVTSTYKPGTFRGITQITDTTPGFEVVLEEGSMRLYKITL